MEGGARWGRLGTHPNRCQGPGEEDAQGGGRRGEGEERLTCLSRLLFLESDFTKEPRGQGLPEGPSGLGFRDFKKGDQRKKGHFNKVMGTSSQCRLCVHRQISL